MMHIGSDLPRYSGYSIAVLAYMVSRSVTIENIWSWVAERLARHVSSANTVDEVWHVDLKQHGMSYLFVSPNPSSTPCLTVYGQF